MRQRFGLLVVMVAAMLPVQAARAVEPGGNGRTAYLKLGNVMVFDGTFNHPVATDGDWVDRVTWCGHDSLVGRRHNIGIVKIPVDHDSTAGTPFVIYHDPNNALRDPACNAAGTRVAAATGDTIVTIPTDGRAGATPLAFTASGGNAHEPAWSSDDRHVAFEESVSATFSSIEIASTFGRFISGGTAVTSDGPGVRHGPSWWKGKIYYWKEAVAGGGSQGIFSVNEGNPNEFGPYGGTNGSMACQDPAALPDGGGFECVGSDTFIKLFPGPRSFNDTDARKPDVEPRFHDHDHGHGH
jgi:hypothetical protein